MLAKVEEVVLQDKLIVSSSPHIRSNESVKRIMLDVVIALTPAIIGSVYLFGLNALKLILISVASSVLSEALIQKLFKRPITITDFSAAITGILIAFNLPASAPWWLPVIGSAFAIIVVKQLFGGLGANFMNPALAARAMLMTSWPVHMTNYTGTRPDVVTSATPLSIMKYGTGAELPTLRDMFIGNIPGVIGETSVEPKLLPYHILGGGLILGAFYMATDYSSSPVTPLGRIIFAVGAGVLTAIIRIKGAYPEGVSYSILLMNVATPLIEKFTKPRVFGKVK
jgi:electron transport complex protein RnfD